MSCQVQDCPGHTQTSYNILSGTEQDLPGHAEPVRGVYPPGSITSTLLPPKSPQNSEENCHNSLSAKDLASGGGPLPPLVDGTQGGKNFSVADVGGVDWGWFQHLAEVEPRGFGKSTKMMIAVIWALVTGRKHFVVYTSNSHDKAVDLIKPIKYEFENNKILRLVYGDQVSQKWAEGEFELKDLRAKVYARGRGQSVRGLKFISYRPDLVILDDIEDDQEVENRDLRLDTQRWLDQQVMKGIEPKRGTLLVVGTVLHPDSLIANLVTKKERPEKYARFFPLRHDALDANGKSIWPDKFSTESLEEERRLDPYSFAQERMNEPIPLESGTFKKAYFQYYELDSGNLVVRRDGKIEKSVPLEACNVYLTVDVAITTKEYSDFTVLIVVAVTPDNDWFVLEYTRERWADPQQTINELFRLNDKYKVRLNGIETVAAQKWLYVNLQKEMKTRNRFLSLQELKADRDKTRRISALQPRFANGAVYLRQSMTVLEEELVLFPKSPHDDVSDALAYIPQIAQAPKQKHFKPSNHGQFQWWRKLAIDHKKNTAKNNKRQRLRHLIPSLDSGTRVNPHDK